MWRMFRFRSLERLACVTFSRHISASNILLKSHYDVLGLTPKATQSDIKTAYYKLSMMYHPDKNKGEDAASNFRDITAAYEVLGNYRLRKLYDRGLLHTPGVDQATHVDADPEEKFYQSRASRNRAPPPTGKTPIYDFDEWARQHYGTSFTKRASAKARWEHGQRLKMYNKGQKQTEITMLVIFTSALLYITFVYLVTKSYDVDETENIATEESVNSLES